MSIVQKYEVASWERCALPQDENIAAATAVVEKNPEDGHAWMLKGHALARLSMTVSYTHLDVYKRQIVIYEDPFGCYMNLRKNVYALSDNIEGFAVSPSNTMALTQIACKAD